MEFTIYSKDGCAFCDRSKMLLDNYGYSYHEIKLERDITRDDLLEAVRYYGHGNTLPMIIREDEHGNKERIGGFNELSSFIKEKK